MTAGELEVLVVDDSAVIRQLLTAILSTDPGLRVSTAPDPFVAMTRMQQRRPDVLVLDIEMPRMDGLTFLRKIMSEAPLPVVICSGVAGAGTEAAFRALEEGAVEIIAKPQLGVREFLQDSALLIIDSIRAAASSRRGLRGRHPWASRPRPTVSPVGRPPDSLPIRAQKQRGACCSPPILALGASTGGTEALRVVLEAMPEDAPPILIVQHMPPPFTTPFARRLDETCSIRVREAVHGDAPEPGLALLAPAGRHMHLARTAGRFLVQISDGPLVSRHRPSVDALFSSVARTAGACAVAAILTGMGDDGARGMLELRRVGASTIAQSEATCAVFGMPKAAIDRGAAEHIVPLPSIASVMLQAAWRMSSAPR